MARSPTTEKVIPYARCWNAAVSGLVDAVSFLSLGHVFTANMTGNVVFLAFAIAGVPELSIARSSCALGAFLVGALVGGRTMADRDADSNGPGRANSTREASEVADHVIRRPGVGDRVF